MFPATPGLVDRSVFLTFRASRSSLLYFFVLGITVGNSKSSQNGPEHGAKSRWDFGAPWSKKAQISSVSPLSAHPARTVLPLSSPMAFQTRSLCGQDRHDRAAGGTAAGRHRRKAAGPPCRRAALPQRIRERARQAPGWARLTFGVDRGAGRAALRFMVDIVLVTRYRLRASTFSEYITDLRTSPRTRS